MSACRVDNPSEVVDVGENVWVKVIGKEETDGKMKLSLSMKVVNQGTGKDQDPNNVVLDQEERKKREFRDYSKQKITLEAVLNTICKKCGCKGHFAKDCFTQPGGTKYSLVPEMEEEEEEEQPSQPNQVESSSKKRKKDKKSKKKKKHKEKRLSSESEASDSLDTDAGEVSSKRGRHVEKHKKLPKKKHKKEKRRDSKKATSRD
ncbi:zinc finger CCHC domain-containing protein 17 isoform X2 [Lissotriton helveticus]